MPGYGVMTTFTGSGLLATLAGGNNGFHIALGIVSIGGAGVEGVERSMRYGERAERHRTAGSKWAQIVNEAEAIVAGLPDATPSDTALADLRRRMDQLTSESPHIPERVFNRFRIGETYLSVGEALFRRC